MIPPPWERRQLAQISAFSSEENLFSLLSSFQTVFSLLGTHRPVSYGAQLILCRALGGSWAQRLSVPHFFDYREQPSFSLQDLSWVPKGRFKQLWIRDWRRWETKEKQSRVKTKSQQKESRPRRNSQALGQGPVSHQWKHTRVIVELFCGYWNRLPAPPHQSPLPWGERS